VVEGCAVEMHAFFKFPFFLPTLPLQAFHWTLPS
jgi:hypothetical protein